MRTRKEILSFLTKNKLLFRERFHVTRIGIFGSFARNQQNESSDVDLLVEFEENTPNLFELKQNIKEFFYENLNIDVDICREKYIKPRFKKSILKETIYAD